MSSPSLLQRLKERKLVQWALAYLAGAFVVFQAVEVMAEPWGISPALQRAVHIVLSFGFFITLVLAWYHGEKGRQRVSGPELLMVTVLMVIAGGVLSMLGRGTGAVRPEEQPASDEGESVAEALARLPGLAVLPFENRSGVPDDQYFTDGIQDDLLTRLQRVRGLRVISRTSTELYRDTELAIPEIGRELDVGYVVEGGVQRAGDQVRINLQLIDVVSDSHVWSESYDQVLTTENLFAIQSEIVETVAGELGIELRQEERFRAARRSTTNLEAYDLYMRAADRRLRSEHAIPLLQEAIERDPGFVSAHAALAMRQAIQYDVLGLRSEERAAEARASAERAVSLAPEAEGVQVAMGTYLYWVEKDYRNALEWLSRASGSLVGDYQYQFFRAVVERRMGRWRQSLASFEAAVSLSPRSPEAWASMGSTYLRMRRYAEAEEALTEAQRLGDPPLRRLAQLTWHRDGSTDDWRSHLEREPVTFEAFEIPMVEGRYQDALAVLEDLPDVLPGQDFLYPKPLLEAETLHALGQNAAAAERYMEAARILEPLIEGTPDDERYHASLGWAYAALGMREEALREARRAVAIMPRDRDARTGPQYLFNLAAVHARLGEADQALAVLEDLLSAPALFAPNMLEGHFRLRPMQDDPRFKALMDRERDRVF
jgi:serine/threonine-protein kinase